MNKERKLSFVEGMAKLHKAYMEKKHFEDKDNLNDTVKKIKKNKTKKNFAEFTWISRDKKPSKINFNLQRMEYEECFSIESYSFSSGNTRTRFLLSGFTVRRPWLLWREEWDYDKDKFVNLQPVLGLSKTDTKESEVAITQLFKYYVNHIGYKAKADYIEDSVLISKNKILKIIES
jgi:hypothetical protein